MQTIIYPQPDQWDQLLVRTTFQDDTLVLERVQEIIQDIRQRGDAAVKEYSIRFDGVDLSEFRVSEQELQFSGQEISPELKAAIDIAAKNIETFHSAQALAEHPIETMKGVTCWQRSVGIERVGLYVPGGTAPLFSTVLMLAVPARIAGCKEINLCTPPDKNGDIHPAIRYAAQVAGVKNVYKLGGVQAIASMAFGLLGMNPVYKIFGPGNQWVTAAKQILSLKEVAIDMPAGPSEVAVIADAKANAAFVASDFLSQAEHGANSHSILFTDSKELANNVEQEIKAQLIKLPKYDYVLKSLEHSKILVLENLEQILEISNRYAPEHLIIHLEDYMSVVDKITNAGSVFLGAYTPESAGDYASGTNHTLPTNGYAKAYSGVNLDSFVKKITFQHISKEGIQLLGPIVETMAENEELLAHKNAVTLRINS